ncbi:MAG: addiction module antidote protein [Massilia sp.]
MVEPIPPSGDGGDQLDSLEAIAVFLADAFESGDGAQVASALASVARATGLGELAAAAGVPREQLRAALNSGELSLEATLAIMKVIDLHLPPAAGGGEPH